MISLLLFALYIAQLSQRLKRFCLWCHVVLSDAGAIGYDRDIVLIAIV